ncbi:MAG: hypothetical protein JWQ01_4808 [Massilia sp.]|nr:hypothetical protein [Massilia sp.]
MTIDPIEWREVAAGRSPKFGGVTDWIDGTNAPVRVGIYERHFTDSLVIGMASMQHWDGTHWLIRGTTKPHWRQVGDYPAWRGITKDQAELHASAGITSQEPHP